MKIDKLGKQPPASPIGDAASRAGQGKASNNTSLPPQSASTSVSLGSTATRLQSMESSMAGTPVADPNKVAQIKQAISDGRFQVNSGVVADKLIQTVRELIDSRG